MAAHEALIRRAATYSSQLSRRLLMVLVVRPAARRLLLGRRRGVRRLPLAVAADEHAQH